VNAVLAPTLSGPSVPLKNPAEILSQVEALKDLREQGLRISMQTLIRYRYRGIGPAYIQAGPHSRVAYRRQALQDWLMHLERQSCAPTLATGRTVAIRGDNRLRARNKRAAR